MKTIKKLLPILIILAVSLSSCKKKDEAPKPEPEKKNPQQWVRVKAAKKQVAWVQLGQKVKDFEKIAAKKLANGWTKEAKKKFTFYKKPEANIAIKVFTDKKIVKRAVCVQGCQIGVGQNPKVKIGDPVENITKNWKKAKKLPGNVYELSKAKGLRAAVSKDGKVKSFILIYKK